MYADDRRYSKEHEWIQVEGDVGTLGITQFAQDELGDVVYVELPEVGTTFSQDDEVGTIESVKAVSELYTPVAGEVIEINEKILDQPELANQDPHGDGWLFRIRLSDPEEISTLMTAEQYQDHIGGE